MRGFAAIAVMLYHKAALPLADTSAYLAVDLFFLLSGVVVAEAYADRMAAGWTIRKFMLVRIVRLWPLYMVGTCIGLAAACLSLATGVDPFWRGSLSKITLFATFFLPGVRQWEGPLFPFNAAAWSLFAELVVNICFAAMCRFGLGRFWVLALAVSAAFLGYEIRQFGEYRQGLDFGAFQLLGGLSRACFSFCVGVLIHRAWQANKLPKANLPAWAFVAAFLAIVVIVPASGAGATFGTIAVVSIVFPILVAGALTPMPGSLMRRLSSLSGRMSYPIYTIHLPAFALAEVLCGGPARTPALAYYLTCATVLLVALPLDKYVDGPARRHLSRWLNISPRAVKAAEPL